MSKKKEFTRIIDPETNEVLIEAELTPAAVKRFIKHYSVWGIYAEVAA